MSVHGKEDKEDESVNMLKFTGVGNHVHFYIDVVGNVFIAFLLAIVAAGEMDGTTQPS